MQLHSSLCSQYSDPEPVLPLGHGAFDFSFEDDKSLDATAFRTLIAEEAWSVRAEKAIVRQLRAEQLAGVTPPSADGKHGDGFDTSGQATGMPAAPLGGDDEIMAGTTAPTASHATTGYGSTYAGAQAAAVAQHEREGEYNAMDADATASAGLGTGMIMGMGAATVRYAPEVPPRGLGPHMQMASSGSGSKLAGGALRPERRVSAAGYPAVGASGVGVSASRLPAVAGAGTSVPGMPVGTLPGTVAGRLPVRSSAGASR